MSQMDSYRGHEIAFENTQWLERNQVDWGGIRVNFEVFVSPVAVAA
jgi:hypothetical protein